MKRNSMKYSLLALITAIILSLGVSLAFAQDGSVNPQQGLLRPNTISYQGRVTVNGQPYDGIGYFKFAIVNGLGQYTWNSDIIVRAQGSAQQIGEPQNPIQLNVRNGYFNVRLGALPDMNPIPFYAVDDIDSALRVWFSTDGTNFTQLPDRPFSSVPWAIMADTLDGLDSADFALSNHNHWGERWDGTGFGLELESSDGVGLKGTAYGSSGSLIMGAGVWGDSKDRVGVWGTSTEGSGVLGVSKNNNGVGGISTLGAGVFGSSQNGIGVYGSGPITGTVGEATDTSGTTYGVYGVSKSADGYGVMGVNKHGTAVRGESVTDNGVVGFSESGVGVYGSGWFFGNAAKFENMTTITPTVIINNFNADAGAPALAITGTTTIYAKDDSLIGAALSVKNPITDGVAISGSGGSIGVYGESNDPEGAAIYGRSTVGNYAGVFTGWTGYYNEDAPIDAHMVLIENYANSTGVNGLAISLPANGSKPGSGVNYVTFFASYKKAIGAIEGNGNGGVVYKSGGADFAELLPAAPGLEPGDVVVIGPEGVLVRSSEPNQTNVAGVYSTAPGFLGGMTSEPEEDGRVPVALVGIVPVKVSAENGAIRPGDLLTPSSTPGHAMKADPVNLGGMQIYRPGTIIGKALEPLDQGTGVIRVLITLH